MKQRVLFGVGGVLFLVLCLTVFPPLVLSLCAVPLCALATYEVLGATRMVRRPLLLVGLLSSVLLSLATAFQLGTVPLVAIALGSILLTMLALLWLHDQLSFPMAASALFGGLLLPLLLLSNVRIFQMEHGVWLLPLPLLAAWGSDTFALFSGMLFGRHKLAPVISPKKTVEGAIGGVVGATVLLLLYALAVNHFSLLHITPWKAALLGACGAVLGQLGDLTFSIIKRQAGIKDYGYIFPGHGGVLDRFDSVLFVAPMVELILHMI
jgi:phosphatidate cytidylyltransferase